MSRSIIPAIYRHPQGDVQMQFREDGWFNATLAAAHFGKETNNWLLQSDTAEYLVVLLDYLEGNSCFLQEFNKIKELFKSRGDSAVARGKLLRLVKSTKLVVTKSGAPSTGGGTWMSPDLAVPFARWLDVRFSIWCDQQIKEILSGAHPVYDQKRARHQASGSFKVMSSMLQFCRDEAGKETKAHHYSNEALLINWALTGEFKKVDRDSLPYPQLDLIAKLEVTNTRLIGKGVPYSERKKALRSMVAQPLYLVEKNRS